ncbi:MAG: hypothetical protein OXR73_12900 [Myxococcales bacterium]|nr:hypothetical protein [Myxococcales bacterium]
MRLFVACAPGLEPLLGEEVRELGFAPGVLTARAGGIEVDADLQGAYDLLFGCRLGLSVRLRLAKFRSTHFAQLERQLGKLSWREWLPAGQPIVVRATARRSRLYHTAAIAERVGRSAVSRTGARIADAGAGAADPGGPLLLHARVERDDFSLSLDLCGGPLQRRGYRKQAGKAPLREDLAAALLRVAGYDGRVPLVDPLCGAGTLVIEAGMIAGGFPPGYGRSFAIERLPFHDPRVCGRARSRRGVTSEGWPPIVGSDRDAGVIGAARSNAARAGVADALSLSCAPLSKCALPTAPEGARGLIVTNPPYGKRVGRPTALRDLYASLGAVRRRAGSGFKLALVTSEPALAHATGIRLSPVCLTDAGGTKVRLYCEAEG